MSILTRSQNMIQELTKTKSTELILAEAPAMDRNPAAVYLASLSASGRRTMHQALDTIAGILTGNADAFSCNWAVVRFQHTTAIRTKLAENYAPATANKMLSAMRGTLKAAWNLDLMGAEDYHKGASVESVKGETLPAGRDLTDGEIRALVEACEIDTTPAGARDAAILSVLCPPCGLRRDEVTNLDLDDLTSETGKVTVRGKRNKERTVYLVNGAKRAMADWLALRGDEPGPLFWPVNKAGKYSHRRMTNQAIYNMLQKRGAEAKVENFSPHDFRRTTAGDLLDAGVDIVTVQKLLGHANPNTTARYDRRPEQAKLDAASKVHFPYRGRNNLFN